MTYRHCLSGSVRDWLDDSIHPRTEPYWQLKGECLGTTADNHGKCVERGSGVAPAECLEGVIVADGDVANGDDPISHARSCCSGGTRRAELGDLQSSAVGSRPDSKPWLPNRVTVKAETGERKDGLDGEGLTAIDVTSSEVGE
jgi:hypothetical protein